MADNYLERQMEQYQVRKAAWEKERKLGHRKLKAKNLVAQRPSISVPSRVNLATDFSD